VAQIPRSLIARCRQHPLNLASQYALFRLAHQINSGKLLCERQMCIMEDRSGSYAELGAA
jgi:hypothetical protein